MLAFIRTELVAVPVIPTKLAIVTVTRCKLGSLKEVEGMESLKQLRGGIVQLLGPRGVEDWPHDFGLIR